MNRTLKIILAIVALILVIGSILFEVKDVSAMKKGGEYEIEKRETNGLWFFHKMLVERYGDENVRAEVADDFNYLADLSEHLLIVVSDNLGLDSSEVSQINNFLSNDNELLFISSDFYLPDSKLKQLTRTSSKYDSLFYFIWPDSTRLVYQHDEEGSRAIFQTTLDYFIRVKEDSTETKFSYEDLVFLEDSSSVFRKIIGDSGIYYIHTVPGLFVNKGTLKTDYLENFNKTLERFLSSNVVLHQENKKNINVGLNEDSLLQYILSQPPLKYAYYLTLLLALIFVFFSSKRKQKAIPIIETTKNTSLEYIKTTSALFMAQNQNGKLVSHMKKNFYHKVKSAYFLSDNDPDFAYKLSKKSKVPLDQINTILKQLNIVDNYSFNDDQLIRLYKDIDSFDKNRN